MKYLLLIFITLSLYLNSENKISIIVPCHPNHTQYLPSLLEDYSDQTVIPDEIVISISEIERVNLDHIHSIESIDWPFTLKIALSKERIFSGGNRNIACSLASGDIIICQDADDIPHKNRVEVIRDFFSIYDEKHLLHGFSSCPIDKDMYLSDAKIFPLRYAQDALKHPFPVQFGQCAFRKEVLQFATWPEHMCTGEDMKFNNLVIKAFRSSKVINLPLVISNTSELPQKVKDGVEYE